MDIQYLLFLQNLRQYTEGFLAPIMDWLTKLAVSFWPMTIIFLIYWAFDRKAGRRMLAGISLGYFMNGFLKLTFCVYRPWIRDSRIVPYGDSKVAATGYSFPSGHSTAATARYGSIGMWFRKHNKAIAAVMFAMIALTMFSRNYLGVHTPQDVLVGFGSTALMLVLGNAIENWSDKDSAKRDRIILAAGLALVVAALLYYELKSYPMDYQADGSLLVDYQKMIPDSFEGLGFVSAYAICRIFERRGFAFDELMDWRDRFFIGVIALIPYIWWDNHIISLCTSLGSKLAGKFLWPAGTVVYVMIIVPYIMKKVYESGVLNTARSRVKA